MIFQQIKSNVIWVCIGLFFVSCLKEEMQEQLQPNIVIILVDDQGWGDLSMNGNPLVETPRIDGIGKNGATLQHFYVNAVCSPTRAALLTGRYAVRGGVYSTSAGGERLDLDEYTFAQAFQEAGYATGAFGKWHNGMQYPYHPNARGFDEFFGYCSGHWGSYVDAILEHNGELVESKGYLTDVLTHKAIEFIEANKDGPFLTYLPLNTPHSPMQVVEPWWEKFEDAELPRHRYSDREKILHSRAAYAMAENIDGNVGRVIDKLKELGIEENTIVMYFSDNGPNGWRWNGGMEGIKGSVNEGGVRSPFVIQWPGTIKAGRQVEEITSVQDLFPTVLDLAGINYTPKNELDGESIAPLLLEDSTVWEDRILVNHWRNRTSIRSQGFRLDESGRLFDMQRDAGQTSNVADSFPSVYEELQKVKETWESEVLSELPVEDHRSFPLGHPEYPITQLPARDGVAHGSIQRSNRWPNCSFYTNWTNLSDSITWEVEVLSAGKFEIDLLYTCQSENVGTEITLTAKNTSLAAKVTTAFDPPLRGMEYDKFERGESYVKDWATLSMGEIDLEAGLQTLNLQATDIPGKGAIDFRLMMVSRVGEDSP
ncbi:MAG: arylsulfatase [Bacteroidota bacterium]